MNITETLRRVRRVFLDTAPVIYYVEGNPRYAERVSRCFAEIDAGRLLAVTSPITLAECLIAPLKAADNVIKTNFAELIQFGFGTEFEPIDGDTAQRAAELRVTYGLSLTDAFQVAVALEAGCDAFLTNDRGLSRVVELLVIVLDDLVE